MLSSVILLHPANYLSGQMGIIDGQKQDVWNLALVGRAYTKIESNILRQTC